MGISGMVGILGMSGMLGMLRIGCLIHFLSVIPEASFESKKFQDFVSIGAQRWLEVIEDWTTFGKVTSHF